MVLRGIADILLVIHEAPTNYRERSKAMKDRSVILGLILLAPIILFSTAHAGEGIPDPRAGWNELWHELMIDITLIGLVFAGVTVYFMVRYKRQRPDEEGGSFKLTPLGAFGWTLIPAFIFMADDIFLAAKNFELWNDYRNVPENAYVVEVEAYMWGWNVKYPDEGIEVNNEMYVPQGRPIMVRLTSRDVVHSFFIPDFRVKWDALPGRTTYLWFYPKERGEHVMTCTEYCGLLHSNMYGKIKVISQDEFSSWIEKNKKEGGAV